MNNQSLIESLFRSWMSQYHRFKHKINYNEILEKLKDTAILTGQTTLAMDINRTIKEIKKKK
ncbi:MAG: hypothetical protein ACXADY_23440 [Candidatus Hodarchaeales archaeon]|jgi:hypothetical protein